MKRLIVLTALVLVVFIVTANSVSAGPIDRYIGHMRGYKTATGVKGKYKGESFTLYAGSILVMERDRRNGKIWIVGIYHPNEENNEGETWACVIALKKIEISPRDVALNVNISEEWIHHCY